MNAADFQKLIRSLRHLRNEKDFTDLFGQSFGENLFLDFKDHRKNIIEWLTWIHIGDLEKVIKIVDNLPVRWKNDIKRNVPRCWFCNHIVNGNLSKRLDNGHGPLVVICESQWDKNHCK